MNLKHLATALVFAIASMGAMAADATLVNVDQENSPFMYSQGGKAAGVYPALIESAFNRMNVPVSIKAIPWKRCIQEIDDGVAGVGGIYKNAERLKKYDYSEPLFIEKLVIFYPKANPINFTKIEDLKGKKVGVIRGWSYGDAFDNARKAGTFTADEGASDDQNFQKMDLGRLDIVVAIKESGEDLMKKYKNIEAVPTPLIENPAFLALAKSANKAALLKQFDQAIKDMKKSGEFQKLVSAELAK